MATVIKDKAYYTKLYSDSTNVTSNYAAAYPEIFTPQILSDPIGTQTRHDFMCDQFVDSMAFLDGDIGEAKKAMEADGIKAVGLYGIGGFTVVLKGEVNGVRGGALRVSGLHNDAITYPTLQHPVVLDAALSKTYLSSDALPGFKVEVVPEAKWPEELGLMDLEVTGGIMTALSLLKKSGKLEHISDLRTSQFALLVKDDGTPYTYPSFTADIDGKTVEFPETPIFYIADRNAAFENLEHAKSIRGTYDAAGMLKLMYMTPENLPDLPDTFLTRAQQVQDGVIKELREKLKLDNKIPTVQESPEVTKPGETRSVGHGKE